MKTQLPFMTRLLKIVPCVLLVILVLSFSNCGGSGDQFADDGIGDDLDATNQNTATQQVTVDVEDCATSTFYEDIDNDGYGDPDVSLEACEQPDDYVADNTDCDDTTYFVNPGYDGLDDADGSLSQTFAIAYFEDVDNDCDGEIDEDRLTVQYIPMDPMGQGVLTEPAHTPGHGDSPTSYTTHPVLDVDPSDALDLLH